ITLVTMPMAGRLLPASWAATAVIAAKTQPAAAIPSPNASESPQGSPGTARPTATSSATTRLASNAVSSPDVSSASRPTAPAPRRSRGHPATGARPPQPEPPAILVPPGVPDHDEHAHPRAAHDAKDAQLPGGQPAQGVQVARRPVDRAGDPVGARALRERLQGRGRGVELLRADDADVGERRQDVDPGRDHDPVPAQRQPGQDARAGQLRAA